MMYKDILGVLVFNKSKLTAGCSYNELLSVSRVRFLPSMYVIFWLFLVQIATSEAQLLSYPKTIIPVPHPVTSLLWAETVHKELGLSAIEIKEVETMVSEFDLPLWRLRDLPPHERNVQAAPLIFQLNRKLAGVLSYLQLERLDQLVWQARGIEVILEPKITLKLNLSPEQTNRIRGLLNTAYNKIASLRNNVEISSESQRAAHIQKLHGETHRNIMAVLSSNQQNEFVKLIGRSFDFSRIRNIACKAPELQVDTWINSSPVRLSELRGKVIIVHFYAFGCGNCIRTLPYYNDWLKHFPESSFNIIGIHRPETKQERDIEKVKDRALEAGIEYPVGIDNESLTWDSWANNIWPGIYLIDKNGFIRYWWYGELNFQGAESEKLLRERITELINES